MLGQPSQLHGVVGPQCRGVGLTLPTVPGWEEIKRHYRAARINGGKRGEALSTISMGGLTPDPLSWGFVLQPDGYTLLLVPASMTTVVKLDTRTDTLTDMGLTLSAGAKFRGGSLHPNGITYISPFANGHIGSYNFGTNTFTEDLYAIPAGSPSRFEGIVTAQDGKLYTMAHGLLTDETASKTYNVTSNVLTINIADSGLRAGDMVGVNFTSGTAVDNDRITLATATASAITASFTSANTSGNCTLKGARKNCVVDPVAGTATALSPEFISNGTGAAGTEKFKSEGTCLGPGGLEIYGAPLWDNAIPVHNIAGNVLNRYGDFNTLLGAFENKFRGAILAWNDWIYFAPYGVDRFCKIHAYSKEIQFFGIGSFTPTSDSAYSGIVMGANGLLYCIPRQQADIAVIDPLDDSVRFIAHGYAAGDNFSAGFAAPNGKIYCSPHNANDILVIDTGVRDTPIEMCLSPYLNKY